MARLIEVRRVSSKWGLKEFLAQLAVDLAMPVNALMGYSAYTLCTITFSSFVSNSTSTPGSNKDEPKA
jgi:hypothetical protein